LATQTAIDPPLLLLPPPPPPSSSSHQYGPLSGRSYEERVIGAYMNGILEIRKEWADKKDDDDMKVCCECAHTGHFSYDCPDRL